MSAGFTLPVIDARALGKVAVLMGGSSAEREISLLSGNGVLAALQSLGVAAQAFDPAQRDLGELKREGFDRVFIALHGRHGEVLVLVVVVALRRVDQHHRQGRGVGAKAQHRAGDFFALDEGLAQHIGVVAGGQRHGIGQVGIAHHLADADRRAFARRLDDQRQAQLVRHGA